MAALPSDPLARKHIPLATGLVDYFPSALVAVAALSAKGNDQHNPGTPLHWDRSKSGDEADALLRHFLQRGTTDVDGVLHTTKVAWRALAMLQKELEAAGAPLAPGARNVPPPTTEETSVLFDIDPALLAQIEQQLAADDPDPESAMGLNVANATPPDSDGHPLSHTAGEATFNAPLNPVSQRDEE